MQRILTILSILLIVLSGISQNVTNVSFHQEDNKVVITYDLDKAADVSVYMSTDGGHSFGRALQHVTGAVGKNVQAGTNNHIVYDALAEYDELKGEDFVFKVSAICVQSCPSTVTDYDSNRYNTVKIGEQCWMKENLRSTHYSDGTNIELGKSYSYDAAYRYYPNNHRIYVYTYGYLYNWKAVMRNSPSSINIPSGVQGICPNDWHVPSYAEWTQLVDYVSSQSQYMCGGNNTSINKSLATKIGWETTTLFICATGNDISTNNATGFSAVPAGNYGDSWLNGFGKNASFWSATDINKDRAYYIVLFYDHSSVKSATDSKKNGFSVRCLHD